jgi:hypothetical protein
MDTPCYQTNGQIAKFNMDRAATCDCGNLDRHGKFIKGRPREGDSGAYDGIYFRHPSSAD